VRNLYMYYLGGVFPGANIEVHDMQFAVGLTPEEGFPEVANRWFGEKTRLHVDVITRINWVDNFDVEVSDTPSSSGPRLFFVNMGAYSPGEIFERHSFELVVAANEREARKKARSYFKDLYMPHQDCLMDIDDCIALEEVSGRHIVLKANPNGARELPLFQGYVGIGQNRKIYDSATDALVERSNPGQ
jgi:hypothetical protein